MKQGLDLWSIHAGIMFTEDGWEGSRTGDIPTFAVVGGTADDAERNAHALFGMPVGTVYTLPGGRPRTITGVNITAYPIDDDGQMRALVSWWDSLTDEERQLTGIGQDNS